MVCKYFMRLLYLFLLVLGVSVFVLDMDVQADQTELIIVTQPEDVLYSEGEKVTFRVEAEGDGLTYCWQLKLPANRTFSNSSATGYNTPEITFEGLEKHDGRQYRCVITDAYGNQVISYAATMTLKNTVKIVTQPEDVFYFAGDTVSFRVEAEGDGLTYCWQVKTPSGSTFFNSGATGYNTPEITFEGLEKRDGQQYRCIVTDAYGNQEISYVATMILKKTVKIVTQPEDVLYFEGDTVTFRVEAEGDGLTYRWQLKPVSNKTFSDSGVAGYDTPEISITGKEARDGRQYRCVITDAYGNQVISYAATMTFARKVNIIKQPTDVYFSESKQVSFCVETLEGGLTYCWYEKAPYETEFKMSASLGCNTNELFVQSTALLDGQQYYCIVTDAYGDSLTSNIVTMYLIKDGETIPVNGDSSKFVAFMTLIFKFVKMEFTIYGFTFSFWQIIVLTCLSGILGYFIRNIF